MKLVGYLEFFLKVKPAVCGEINEDYMDGEGAFYLP